MSNIAKSATSIAKVGPSSKRVSTEKDRTKNNKIMKRKPASSIGKTFGNGPNEDKEISILSSFSG